MTDVVWREATGHTVASPLIRGQGQLFPVVNEPFSFYCAVTQRVISAYPRPVDGDMWVIHPWSRAAFSGPQWDIYVHSYDQADVSRAPNRFGPPVRDCDQPWCVYSDGCGHCNPDEYAYCEEEEGRHGSTWADHNRLPRAGYPDHGCTCWNACAECGDYEPPARMNYLGGLEIDVCDHCVRRSFTWCEHCNEYSRDEDGHDDCPFMSRGSDGIHPYDYKPFPVFHGDGPLYLGVEIELDTCGADVGEVAEYVSATVGGVGYLKSDSTIDEGFELVTHPMSYTWALQHFPWGMFAQLRHRYGMHNDSACGIHVHVSRDGFTDPAHAYRWQKFVYRNRPQVQRLARRADAEWADFGEKQRAWQIHYAHDLRNGRNKKPWWLGNHDKQWSVGSPAHDRYQAINTCNEETFEVRVFAGSVYQSQVRAALGFCHATVEYTRTLTTPEILKNGGWTWDAFCRWVARHNENDRYDSLLAEIGRLVP